jgi:glutathione synthase/RimK-type ligase-like ATP-grasp enzyme
VSVLVLTETSDLAADLIVLELQRRGVLYHRLNTDAFPDEVGVSYDPSSGSIKFETTAEIFWSQEVEAAWCRHSISFTHPDPYVDREAKAFLSGLWQQAHWFWMNSPSAVATADNKLWQLKTAFEIGLEIPATIVSNQLQEVQGAFNAGPIIVKTIGGAATEYRGMHHHLFSQVVELQEISSEEVRAAPCIFQKSAKPGTDVRITVAGDTVFATDIDSPDDVLDWRAAPPEAIRYSARELPSRVVQNCLALCRKAELTYGAFDFVRQPDGSYIFLEINPSGQWGWIEHATGQPITAAIVDVLVQRPGST